MANNLYLITGDDLFERENNLTKIKDNFGELMKGINFVVIDKDNLDNLINEVNTFPFGFSEKLIVVNIASKATSDEETSGKNDWFTPELSSAILASLDVNTIVFIGDFQARSKVYKFVSQNGKCIECNKPKNKRDIAPWAIQIAKQYGKNISSENANYLIQVCGADKLMLYNEIQKLVDYVRDRTEITKEDIEKVGIRTLETIIFDLTDYLGARNISKALICLEELLKMKEPLQKILIMIARHFKSLLVTKICLNEGKNPAEELNTKFTFIVSKYKDQAKKFSLEELNSLIVDLANLDADSKVGKIDLKTGLELSLVKVMWI